MKTESRRKPKQLFDNRIPLLSKKEFAKLAGVSMRTIDRLRKIGLPFVPVGWKIQFHPDEAMDWFRNHYDQERYRRGA